jgi:hypothetical protein
MAERQKKSLIRTFAKAAGGAVLGVALTYGAFVGVFYAGRGDPLTQGEQQMVTDIFGDEINATSIRKHFKDKGHITHLLPAKDGTVLPFISHIDIFGDDVASKDYSAEDPRLYGFFAHEATHCWQNQNHAWKLHDIGVYEFTLKQGDRFGDFGGEQQAEIIEAYAMRYLHPDGAKNASPENAGFDSLLMQVVEERFPKARETRLKRDCQRTVAQNMGPS